MIKYDINVLKIYRIYDIMAEQPNYNKHYKFMKKKKI